MTPFVDRIRKFFLERKGSRLVLILLAALVLELVSIVQYYYTRNLLRKEEARITRVELTMKSDIILNTLEEAEMTMRENAWNVSRSLASPDSLFGAALRMIGGNPLVAGSCIAVVPDYYPEKGRLFEPYAHKEDGMPRVEQIAGPDHDYTQGPDFVRALREDVDFWGDPYEYGEDPVQQLTTYTYPVRDRHGRLAAVCGLDIDLTWLSDTLNANQYYPSSFGFMLTENGRLVAGPQEGRVSPETVAFVAALMADSTSVREVRGHNRINCIKFRDPVTGKKAQVDYKPLPREPHWVVAQVSYHEEVFAPVKRMMWRILLLGLAGLAVLVFIIDRFARNGKRLYEADLKQAAMGSELRVARQIQERMLPAPLPDREDLVVQGSLTPAKEVGGDLYDYSVRDGKLFFCIGDVSGKGVPAALVMSVVLFLFRSISDREDDPARIVGELNREVCRRNESGMFVTFFLGVLDLATGVLRYCNAGHDHPFLVRDTAEELPAVANMPVGAFGDFAYQVQETTIAPGTVLFLYTDGVTEAKNALREQFGRKRLTGILSEGPREPEALDGAVLDGIRAFAGEAAQSDDITMLAIRYEAPAELDKETV
jgi:serine phosphatase RsbU (regulator of sigma subunit)